MKKYIFSLMLICSIVFMAQAQKKTGYFVTLQGDTISGTIKAFYEDINYWSIIGVCHYKSKKEKIDYAARDLKELHFTSTRESQKKDYYSRYIPFLGDTLLIPPPVCEGILTLHELKEATWTNFAPGPNNIPMGGGSSAIYVIEKEGNWSENIHPFNYKRRLKKLFTEYPSLIHVINTKGYKFENIEALINLYNNYEKQ